MRPTRSPLVLIVLLLWAGVDDFCLPQTLVSSPAGSPCAEDDEFSFSEAECALRRSAQDLKTSIVRPDGSLSRSAPYQTLPSH